MADAILPNFEKDNTSQLLRYEIEQRKEMREFFRQHGFSESVIPKMIENIRKPYAEIKSCRSAAVDVKKQGVQKTFRHQQMLEVTKQMIGAIAVMVVLIGAVLLGFVAMPIMYGG